MARKPNLQQISLKGWSEKQSGVRHHSEQDIYLAPEYKDIFKAECLREIKGENAPERFSTWHIETRRAANSIGQIYMTYWLEPDAEW